MKLCRWILSVSVLPLFGMQVSGAGAPYYDSGTPAPAFIQQQFGPFGPRDKTYPVPEGAVIVAPDGLESNSGASVDEPTTIEKAIREVKTGSVIVMRGGEYRTGDLTFNKQITVQPYLDERPVIKGSKIASDWEKRGAYWVTRWKPMFKNNSPKWYNPERHGPPCLWNGDAVIFDGRMFRPANTLADLEENFFFCDYDAGEIYLLNDPADKTVEITVQKYGFVREHDETADAEGPTFLGLDVMHYAGSCINIEGVDHYRPIALYEMPVAPVKSRIEDCRIMFCSQTGMHVTSPDAYIAHNEFSFHGNNAIMTRMSHRAMFEHNTIHHSNFYEHLSFPSGIKVFNQGHHVVVRNNYLADMSCIAVWYDVGLKENIVMNNYFKNCGISVKIEISHRSTIAGNVMDHSRMFICNSADCLIFNNTLIDSRIDFMRNNRGTSWSDRFSFDHAATGPGPKGYHGHQVANNVFAGKPGNPNVYMFIEDKNDADNHFQWDLLSNNLYLNEADQTFQAEWRPGKMEMTDYATLADLKAAAPYGAYMDRNVQLTLSQDELFVNRKDGDFRLKDVAGIPEGVVIPADILDMLGWDVGTKGVGALLQKKRP